MSESEWVSIFANNLAEAIKRADMTQREFADEAGLSESTISHYIHKRKAPSFKALINMSYVLNCSLDDLMDFGDMIK